eukprot:10048774-Alexandrium_andersonii.AAC.1
MVFLRACRGCHSSVWPVLVVSTHVRWVLCSGFRGASTGRRGERRTVAGVPAAPEWNPFMLQDGG